METFQYNDGGRSYYFKGKDAGDCVTRAIVIATGFDYKLVYDDLSNGMKDLGLGRSARNGVNKKVYHKYLLKYGFKWVPTMKIGQGCEVHLKKEELPNGILITRLSKHLSCVLNGVINDTYNPSRDGTRCVYGYYIKEK